MTTIATVNVLGTDYKIIRQSEVENPKLKDFDGLAEFYTHTLHIAEKTDSPNTVDNVDEYFKKVIRHEIVHAFLKESGLDANSDWARNEEIVDWFALQGPKIMAAWVDAGCV